MEDILTSNVFGLMKFLPPSDALVPFLRQAEGIGGFRPFEDLSPDVDAEYEYWPAIEESGCFGCEPDVVIRLKGPHHRLIFVEAKYLSGKASEEDSSVVEPYDQLAREWDNLESKARRENADPLLLYVTADIALPRQEIESSAGEYSRKRGDRADKLPFTCAWISWRKLSTLFRAAETDAARDWCAMADRLGLCYFESVTQFDARPLVTWNFATATPQFRWGSPGRTAVLWSFSQ
jgi:hypothetical protein